jgi:UDP-N-acetylglucosamine--N-acetylmuramyl-(pentapeptide) pyrophosphoryl-undecaprenol N-acetylglucosamine transferase
LAGGGGHTGYAKILADELYGRAELRFLVPEDDPLSKELLREYGPVDSLIKPRHPTTPTWRWALRFPKAFYNSIWKIDKNLDYVVSTGSNFCIAPSFIAWLKGISVINLESADRFTRASSTAKILQPFAKVTALHWEEQKKILKGRVFGPFLPRRRVEPRNEGYVLIAGGTYGYKELLDAASNSQLENVVLQTGRLEPHIYIEKHPEWRVFSTIDNFYEVIAGAEVAVAPPGATPLEAIAYGKSVVIVRYPVWSRAGTLLDAELFANKLNAPFLSEISPRSLVESIQQCERMPKQEFTNGAVKLAEYLIL